MTLSSASPGLYYDENSELPLHASLSYHVVMAAGPPAHPLEFPMPTVHRAVSVSGLAIDHRKHDRVYEIHGALMGRTEKRTAYQFQKKIAKTCVGCIKLCLVLRRRSGNLDYHRVGEHVEWISTEEMVAIKASSKIKMRQRRGHHLEDPMKGA